ncbi:MAG TPA: tripartite tricarboxylate transporter substrate binding protein [Burkholderiales bacterium]|nr:tripartite tricarboxylate transporter substrate binding protein [Burkholderiales bacterium]
MKTLRLTMVSVLLPAALALMPGAASAQPYPTRSIRLIVPFPPGGATDTTSRILAHALSQSLGQQVVVDNRPGATGRIGTELVAKAPGDGYTLLFGSAGPNVILPGAYSKLPYDAVRDFAPITLVGHSDHVLVTHPSLPVKSVKDIVALARKNPGQLTFASAGIFSVAHMSAEFFKQVAKVDMVHVPYKGGGLAIVATFTGEVSMYFGGAPTIAAYRNSSKLRLIATTGARRSQSFPGLPTIGETLPGYTVTQWLGVLAPATTPREIVTRLHTEIVKAVTNPKVAAQLAAVGADPATTSPEEFLAYIKGEIAKWAKVVKASGIALE